MAENGSQPETQITVTNVSNSEDDNNGLASENSGNNGDGAGEIVVIADEHSNEAPTDELGSHNPDATTGEQAGISDAVAIAGIEAERDITVASIHADTEQTRIERSAEALEEIVEATNEVEQCRAEIAQLRERLETMESSLTPPPPPVEEIAQEIAEEITETALETPEEPSLIPQSIATPTIETQTEVSVENEEGERAVVEAKARRKYIAI